MSTHTEMFIQFHYSEKIPVIYLLYACTLWYSYTDEKGVTPG